MDAGTRYPGVSLFQSNDLASTRPDPPPAQKDFFLLVDLVQFVIHAWAAMLYAFMRRGFGRGFFGLRGMGGLAVLSGWAVACVLDWLYMARRDYRRARQLHDAEHEHAALVQNYEHYFNK